MRAEVVPGHAAHGPSEPVQPGLRFEPATNEPPNGWVPMLDRASRHPWAWLLARGFAVDVMVCPRCAGAMRLVKLATTRKEIAKALA